MLIAVCIASCLLGPAAGDSLPPRPIRQLMHTTWTPKVGAGPIGIQSLAQTTDGYIWIASFFGLWRFDGVRFLRYVPLGSDTLPRGSFNHLHAARDGSLWVVGERGVAIHLQADRAHTYGKMDRLPPVWGFAESSTGDLLAATIGGLFRFSGGTWQPVPPAWGYPGTQARVAWFDRDDGLWVQTEDRVVYLPAGGRQFLDTGMRIRPSGDDHVEFAQEKDGTIWIAERESVHTLRKIGDQPGLQTEISIDPQAMLIDRGGSLWVASGSDGLRRVPDIDRIRGRRIGRFGSEVERFTMKDGLLTDIPTVLLADREGNVWVGSANGLERFREGAFTPIPTLAPTRPRFVMAGRDSSVWTGAYNHGSLQRFGPHGQAVLNPGFPMVTIAQDSSGRTMVVDGHRRLLRLTGSRFLPVPLRPGTARGLYSLTIDPAGTVWVYSQDLGLLRLAGDSLVPVARLDEPSYHTGLPFSDSKGRIWVGQVNKVSVYTDGKLTQYGAKEGIGGFVYGFFEDRSGSIWVATGDGLSKFLGDRFRTVSDEQGIPGESVYGAAQDDSGAWWLATLPGILRFPPGEIERAIDDSTYVPRYRVFDESDGMVGALVKGYWGPVLAKSGDGQIWVTTDSGLARIDPQRVPVAVPPPVSLEVARIGGREISVSDTAAIQPGASDMEIDYTSLTFGTPERIQFRYRMEGADPVWHEAGTRRRAYYTGLAPGRYRFRVTASYGDGTWNEPGATWNFRVLPAWYQTLWFKALVVLVIGGLGGAAVALLQRGRHRREQRGLKERYEATLAERARIAQDLHDTLLQGFAGVSMQLKAAERALPDEPDVAAETLIHVQRLTRETLREARERVLDLHEPDLRSVDVAGALEASGRGMLAPTGIEFTLKTRGDRRRLPRTVEIAVIRIGREAITNVLKHAEARRIDVEVAFDPEVLSLVVRDDGRGFTPEQGEDARRKGHLGLSGMRERARRAGGTCEVKPGPQRGTVVVVTLPIGDGGTTA